MASFSNTFQTGNHTDPHLMQFLSFDDLTALSRTKRGFTGVPRELKHRAAEAALPHFGDILDKIPDPLLPLHKIEYFYQHTIPDLQREIRRVNPSKTIDQSFEGVVATDVRKYKKAEKDLDTHSHAKQAAKLMVASMTIFTMTNWLSINGLCLADLASESDPLIPFAITAYTGMIFVAGVALSGVLCLDSWRLMNPAKATTLEKISALTSETCTHLTMAAKAAFTSMKESLNSLFSN